MWTAENILNFEHAANKEEKKIQYGENYVARLYINWLEGTYRESNFCNNFIHSTIFDLANGINGIL